MSNNILLNKKVLVAEDNTINQFVVNQALLKLGANADIAGNGFEAIEKLKEKRYDLILMDLQMPAMDGYECANYIRNELKSTVPIIAMTASAFNSDDKKCYESGMNEYVSKPITIENLSSVIQKVLLVPPEQPSNSHILAGKNISIDLTMLYEISGDDENYVAVMVQTFLENMPGTVSKIQQCLLEENWEGLYQAAHFAKSTLSVVKVREMFDAVLAIEGYAKSKSNLDQLPSLVQKVGETFLIAQEVLTKKFNEPALGTTNK